ncbi:MAG: 1,4-dihydroxy-2-naphthoate octaprenyltransferase [Calditrichaeota bacterium]|nr:1,4-dihydroxy-2-naphthoate octaprenyltransferase [Calditrichota bacterium]
MTANTVPLERSRFSIWLQAIRAFAFPASIVPVLTGALLTFSYEGPVAWELFPLVVICSILYHTATNLISDYFDWKRGVDKDYTFGSSRVIADGLLTPGQVLRGGWIAFGIGIALGLVLVAVRGVPMLTLGVIGLLGGYLYTGRPVGYKYIALGDVGVFLLMGPLMVIGSYAALTGEFARPALTTPLLVSIPIGLLTAAILHANNTRDIRHDGEARIRTFAGLIGHSGAKIEYLLLVGGAFVAVVWMAMGGILPLWSLLVLLSLPPALKNIGKMLASRPNQVEEIAMLDVLTAQHHLMFGVLLMISIVLGRFF